MGQGKRFVNPSDGQKPALLGGLMSSWPMAIVGGVIGAVLGGLFGRLMPISDAILAIFDW